MLCDVLFNSYELEINYSFKKNTYIYKGEMHFSGLELAGFLNFCLSYDFLVISSIQIFSFIFFACYNK